MAIYPVQIPNRSTMYVEGTKGAITAKLKSLGYTKFTITEAISKTKLIHAYGPEKRTVIMGINETIKRIKNTAKLKVLAIKKI